MKVLFTGCTFNKKQIEELKEMDIYIETGRVDFTEEELTKVLNNYDCYINGGDEICTKKVIEENKHLKLISFMGTGYQKYIDVKVARENDIPVSYTPNANAKSVAEYTVALILDAVKKISYSNAEVKKGNWEKYEVFNLEGRTLGIIGMGAIGSHVAKILCDGFGMKLLYNSKTIKPSIDKKYNTSMVSLNEVFKNSDIISVNATCTDENKGMISSEQLDLMKENAILINTARTELIDRDTLIKVINKINCVALDGYYEEPINKNEEILSMDDSKFIITPHNAYNSIDALYEMEKMLIESLEDVKNNKEIRNTIIRKL